MKGIFDPYVRSNLQLYDKKTQVCPLLAIWDIQLATNTNAIHKEFCPIVRHVELLLGSPDWYFVIRDKFYVLLVTIASQGS